MKEISCVVFVLQGQEQNGVGLFVRLVLQAMKGMKRESKSQDAVLIPAGAVA